MKKDLLLLLSLMLLLSVSAIAGPRSYQQAKAIAQRQAALLGIEMDAEVAASAKAAPRMSVSSAVSPSATCYYVFANGEDKGFTIVSGDDRMPEVVGYSAQGTYDPDHLPANYVDFMKAYQETVEALLKGDAQVSGGLAEARQWRAERASSAVAPLLGGIKWNQMAPYNNMCPSYNGTNRAVTGCVATAMAQVMMYYQYPKELKATIKAYTAKSYGIQIPEISSGATYDWDNMLSDYSKSDYSSAQADAVAKLMYHCGAAVEMDYGPSSGANVTPAILATYFGYDADLMQDLTRTCFTLQQWMTLIDNELKAKRPILYSGQSSDGGHEFVCDGSDGKGLYHINWGWGGYQDGYFDLTILQPQKGGAGSGSAVDGFNRDCSMIIGIAPDNGKVDEPLASYPQIMSMDHGGMTGITWTKTTREHVLEPFQAEARTCFVNQSTTDFSGYFAYGIKANGTIVLVSDYEGGWNLPAVKPNGGTWGTYGDNPELTINYPFPQGINVIYPVYSYDTKNWHVCSFYNNQPFIIDVDATKMTPVTTPLAATVTAEEGLYTGMTNPLTVTFTNSMDMEFNGLVKIYTNTTSTKPSSKDFDLYITIPARGSVTRQIEIPETSSSQQYLWITDVANKEAVIVNGQRFTLTTAAAPKFTVVSSESNATPGQFGVGKYYEVDYKLPLVEDDKLVVRFGVRNTGGPGYLDYCFVPYNANAMGCWVEPNRARAAGNGAITYVEYTVTPDEVGSHSILVYFNFYDFATGRWIDTPCTIPSYKIYTPTGSYRNLKGNTLIAYVTGVLSSISSVKTDAGTYVRGEKGAVVIKTDADKRLGIYHVGGQKTAEVRLTAGQEQTVALRPGIYIVEGIKVVVR
nr:C10 family peptidase [Prevotella sp.]